MAIPSVGRRSVCVGGEERLASSRDDDADAEQVAASRHQTTAPITDASRTSESAGSPTTSGGSIDLSAALSTAAAIAAATAVSEPVVPPPLTDLPVPPIPSALSLRPPEELVALVPSPLAEQPKPSIPAPANQPHTEANRRVPVPARLAQAQSPPKPEQNGNLPKEQRMKSPLPIFSASATGVLPLQPVPVPAHISAIQQQIPGQTPLLPGPYPMPNGMMVQIAMPATIPSLFHNKKLRSGKWTPEEERYADLLIVMFENGHIDEKNGCTLRSFLSKRLHCAPMRISKKYAGKGIGKMVFLTKRNQAAFQGVTAASMAAKFARLQDAEMKFYRVAFPDAVLPYPTGMVPLLPNTAVGLMQHPGINPLAIWPQHPPLLVPGPINAPAVRHNSMAQPFPAIQSAPSLPAVSAPSPGTQRPEERQHKPGSASHSTETFISSAQTPTHILPAPPPAPSSVSPGMFDRADSGSLSSNLRELHQTYMNVVGAAANQGSTSGKPSVAPAPSSAPVSRTLSPAIPLNGRISQQTSAQTFSPPQSNEQSSFARKLAAIPEIPDLLSGFDIVTSGTAKNKASAEDEMPHSPPFTSRSFDDFHRFLGKGLLPPAANENKSNGSGQAETVRTMSLRPTDFQGIPNIPAQYKSTSSPGRLGPTLQAPPSISHPADTYVMSAQHSVYIASQHSAYLPTWGDENAHANQASAPASTQPPEHFVHQPILPLAAATQADLPTQQGHHAHTVSEPSNTSSDMGTDESEPFSGNEGFSDSSANDSDDSRNTNKKRRHESHDNRRSVRQRDSRGANEIRVQP